MELFPKYVEANLSNNEQITYKAKIHWYVYLTSILPFFMAFIVYQNKFLSAAFMFLAVCMMLKAYIYTQTTELAVTNMRIIAKVGWISRSSVELRHDKVESVMLDQSILGRILGFGTIFLHGTGSGITPLRDIDNPLEFRKHALDAIEKKS
jgi:uncharacterized membrane protein YdbT with pleckstrin-like domain